MKSTAHKIWQEIRKKALMKWQISQRKMTTKWSVLKQLMLSKAWTSKKFLSISAGSLVILIISSILLTGVLTREAAAEEQASEKGTQTETQTQEVSPRTIHPELQEDESSRIILGTVLSNETANIYPRRDGIVEDILVDIGDQVEKNQVLAVLLPPGVEGESEAMIAEKRAEVGEAAAEFKNSRLVATAMIGQEEQELEEKKVALENALLNRIAILDKSETIAETTRENENANADKALQEIEVTKARIQLLEQGLAEAGVVKENSLEQERFEILQKTDQAASAVSAARLAVERALLGEGGRRNNQYIAQEDVPGNIGVFNSTAKYELISDLNSLTLREKALFQMGDEEKRDQIPAILNEASHLLGKAQLVLNATTPGSNQEQSDVNDLVSMVNMQQAELLEAKEMFEDAINGYTLLGSEESEKITELKNSINEAREELKTTEENYRVMRSQKKMNIDTAIKELGETKAFQDSEIAMLRQQLEVADKKLGLIRATQLKMVEQDRSRLGVQSAMLQKEIARSGNTKILSPFSGIVSKRFLVVGESTGPGMSAFELVDVQTSLGEKAKREVQFGLPEALIGTLKIGDNIAFFIQGNEKEIFTAEVSRMSPQVDLETHTVTVRAKLPDELNIPHNTSVRIRIAPEEVLPMYKVLSTAITREDEKNYLWILDPGTSMPVRIEVNVVSEDGEYAEVSGAISIETEIVLDPPDSFIPEAANPLNHD
ncbi:MAG: efflux RND transporter periplasmic adaptor subunit [bacterium]|nr:efflux RND transporter periplasmic adaptor subunit [bacterium]